MLQAALQKVLSEYRSASQAPLKANSLASFIRQQLPTILEQAASIGKSYKIQGSPGQGNWAEIPWLCVFDKDVTTTAEKGYYIVYLFDAEMGGVYLSLNQGYVQYEEKFKVKGARTEIRKTALKLQDQLRSVLGDFNYDPINLHAKNNLGKGYELGHICGKFYPTNALPDDAVLIDDLRNLMGVYREVKGLAGIDILQLKAVLTEEESYQFESNEADPIDLPAGPLPKKEQRQGSASLSWARSRRRARNALKRAGYLCEIDARHHSFFLPATGKPYMESHHLVPMEQQMSFDVDIDVPENIVSLCPNCHRMIHLASAEEKKECLQKLFEQRKAGLDSRGIRPSLDDLMNYY